MQIWLGVYACCYLADKIKVWQLTHNDRLELKEVADRFASPVNRRQLLRQDIRLLRGNRRHLSLKAITSSLSRHGCSRQLLHVVEKPYSGR